METHGWKLSAETDIVAQIDNLVKALKKPLVDEIHSRLLAEAIHYRDMNEYGNKYTSMVVLEAAERLLPPVYLSNELYFWNIAAREHLEAVHNPSSSAGNVTVRFQRVHAGEYLVWLEASENILRLTDDILGGNYICFGNMISHRHSSPENSERAKEFMRLQYKKASIFSVDVLDFQEIQARVSYIIRHENIVSPNREVRAEVITNTILEEEDFTGDYATIYSEVIANLPEVDAHQLLQTATQRTLLRNNNE